MDVNLAVTGVLTFIQDSQDFLLDEQNVNCTWDMVVYHQMLHPGNLQVTSQNIYGSAVCGEYFEAQSIFAALDVLEPNEFTKNYQFLKYKTNR